jgi:hypothetical protein
MSMRKQVTDRDTTSERVTKIAENEQIPRRVKSPKNLRSAGVAEATEVIL